MITPLKHWSLNRISPTIDDTESLSVLELVVTLPTNSRTDNDSVSPTIDDTESLSVLELVGKVTTKINQLITDYNEFIDVINKTIEEFESSTTKNMEEFQKRIEKQVHDYIDLIDSKIDKQDKVIADAVLYMKENISSSITTLVNEMKELGEIDDAILTAFDDISGEVNTLKEDVSNMSLNVSRIEDRVMNLENTNTYLQYDENEKSLTFVFEKGVMSDE